MDTSFKSRSFKFIFWIMIILLGGDTIDTIYRFIFIGYFGEGTSFPGVDEIIRPNTIDLILFIIAQIGIIYGLYLLYNLKKIGGYWFLGSNIFYLVYASIFGPIAEIGIFNILLPVIIFFCVYIILTIGVPLLYPNKFE